MQAMMHDVWSGDGRGHLARAPKLCIGVSATTVLGYDSERYVSAMSSHQYVHR